jgi:dienelactone hydrolase
VKKISLTLAVLVWAAYSGRGSAQLAGVTPEMIASSLPEEGAPKAIPGPYAVTAEPAFGATGLRTFRPTSLERFPKRDTLPVVVWGNGGCAVDAPKYAGFLSTIASHGFLVITTTGPAPQEGVPRHQASAADLSAAVDWTQQENMRDESPLHGKIDTHRVTVMGQSCGGALAITLGADPRVSTIGVFNSGVTGSDALTALHGPVLLITGGERDFLMGRSKATFDAIEKLPTFYGSRHGAGHTATMYHPGGGEFANVASNWALWQLKGDRKASAMFVGDGCSLCTNPNWDTQSKRLTK